MNILKTTEWYIYLFGCTTQHDLSYLTNDGNCAPCSRSTEFLTTMAPHSSTLAWEISWTEEPGRLQAMGSLRVWHDRVTSLSLSCIGEGNGNPLQCSCLENPRDRGAWWAAICGVAQSRTQLKRLSSSSSSSRLPGKSRIVHFKWVYSIVYELYLNKAVFKNGEAQI